MKKNAKKKCQMFAESKKVATFATAFENKPNGHSDAGFWKSFEKSSQKIWWFEKLVLSLHPLSPKNESRVLKKKVLKKFQKDLVVTKKGFTFAPLSAS